MKLNIILIFCLFYCSTNGQNKTLDIGRDTLPDHRRSTIGIYVGYNGSYSSNGGISGYEKSFGASIMYGLYGTFVIKGHWQFETGLGGIEYDSKYLRFGNSYNASHDTFTYNDQLITSAYYITIPTIFKYYITKRSSILAGIRVSGEVSNNQQSISGIMAGNNNQVTGTGPGEFLIFVDKLDLGLILGYEFSLSHRLLVSIFYNKGFIPIFSKSDINYLNNHNPYENNYFYPAAEGNYNNSLSLRLCYSFLKY